MGLTPASDSLRSDHREIEIHLDSLLALLLGLHGKGIAEVRHEFDEIRRISARHFEKEEKVLYPRLRQSAPELLARLEEQHEHARELESHLEALVAADRPAGSREATELRRLGIEFHDTLQHHIVEEEDHLLRVADAELSEQEQVEMGRRMEGIGG